MAERMNIVSMPKRPDDVLPRVVNSPTEQYIVPDGYTLTQRRVLMGTRDDVEIEVDPRTYDLMENDTAITKCKRILVTGVLADELQMAPGATEDEVGTDEYEVYVKVMEFSQRTIKGLNAPLRDTLEQLLGNAIKYGHGIAEIEWEYRMDGFSKGPKKETLPTPKDGQTPSIAPQGSVWQRLGMKLGFLTQPSIDASEPSGALTRPTLQQETTRLMPKSIKVKPRGSARFVVDNFMTVVGLTPRFKNGTTLAWNEIVDREKFLVLTLHKQDEDPRGRSSYRPAFNWVNIKNQMPAEMLRYVLEEIVPKAVATLPEGQQGFEMERDAQGNIIYEDPETKKIPKMVTAAESFKRQIENFRGGSGAVIPNGATLQPYKTGLTGGGDAAIFQVIIKVLNDEIENAILLQTLAQSEGAHQARSASQQVAELLHNLIFWIRWVMSMMILTDLLETTVRKNLGDWAVEYLPQLSLGDFVRRDWGDDLEKVADAYFKGFIDDTQRPELMSWLNLPRPGPSRSEEAATQLALNPPPTPAKQDVNGQPIQPNSNRPDKQSGNKDRNAGNGTEKKNVKQLENIGLGPLDVLGHHRGRSGFVKRDISSRNE